MSEPLNTLAPGHIPIIPRVVITGVWIVHRPEYEAFQVCASTENQMRFTVHWFRTEPEAELFAQAIRKQYKLT